MGYRKYQFINEKEEVDDDWDVEKQFVKGLSDERG